MSNIGRVRAYFAALVGLAVTGCAVVDSVDPRYDNINRSSAKARNESILLNIVRASENAPLNFIAFSRVSGTTQANVGMASPTFVVGPNPVPATIPRDVTFNNSSLNAGMIASGSFDITVLESKDFYSALLSPVDLVTLNYFVRQGYSRELLFWLFTDSVRETILGKTVEYRNEPGLAPEDCVNRRGRQRCFDDMVDVAIATGLTVETQVEERGSSSSGGAKKGSESSKSGTVIHARLCFDRVLEARAKRTYAREIFNAPLQLAGHQPTCGNWRLDPRKRDRGETDTLTFSLVGTPFGTIKYEIITRSTFGIYQFLGRILQQGLTEQVLMRLPVKSPEDRRILAVRREGAGGCFVDINYNGEYFCVPNNGAESTKRIFSLLAQLLALKTQVGDLAITPTVRVTP